MWTRTLAAASLTLAAVLLPASGRPAAAQSAAPVYHVPVTHYTLPNGLKVVLSRDTTAPTVAVAVSYQRIAQTYLDPSKMTRVVVGDQAAIAGGAVHEMTGDGRGRPRVTPGALPLHRTPTPPRRR